MPEKYIKDPQKKPRNKTNKITKQKNTKSKITPKKQSSTPNWKTLLPPPFFIFLCPTEHGLPQHLWLLLQHGRQCTQLLSRCTSWTHEGFLLAIWMDGWSILSHPKTGPSLVFWGFFFGCFAFVWGVLVLAFFGVFSFAAFIGCSVFSCSFGLLDSFQKGARSLGQEVVPWGASEVAAWPHAS